MKTGICKVCNKEFTYKTFRKTCSDECKSLSQKLNKEISWKHDEVDLLYELAETMPISKIVERLQQYEQDKGYPIRSPVAIRRKISRLGMSARPVVDYLTINSLAKELGIHPSVIEHHWIKKGLKVYEEKFHTHVKLHALMTFIRRNPECFAYIDRNRLFMVLGNERYSRIKKLIPEKSEIYNRKYPKPVVNLTTKIEYKSIGEAARKNHVTHGAISKAVNHGKMCLDSYWSFL